MPLSTKHTRNTAVRAWYATEKEVRALVQLVIDSYGINRAKAEADLPAEFAENTSSSDANYQWEKFEREWTPRVTVTEQGQDEFSGGLDEVFNAVTPRRVERISFAYPGYGANVDTKVSMTFGGFSDGFTLRVEDSDPVRAEGIRSAVTNWASESCPWWSWFFAGLTGYMTAYVIVFGVTLLIAAGLIHHYFEPSWGTAFGLASWVGSAFALTANTCLLSSRIFPRFQLLSEGQRPRSGTIMGGIAGALGTGLLALLLALAFA